MWSLIEIYEACNRVASCKGQAYRLAQRNGMPGVNLALEDVLVCCSSERVAGAAATSNLEELQFGVKRYSPIFPEFMARPREAVLSHVPRIHGGDLKHFNAPCSRGCAELLADPLPRHVLSFPLPCSCRRCPTLRQSYCTGATEEVHDGLQAFAFSLLDH